MSVKEITGEGKEAAFIAEPLRYQLCFSLFFHSVSVCLC